jgi:hypothetical protein
VVQAQPEYNRGLFGTLHHPHRWVKRRSNDLRGVVPRHCVKLSVKLSVKHLRGAAPLVLIQAAAEDT